MSAVLRKTLSNGTTSTGTGSNRIRSDHAQHESHSPQEKPVSRNEVDTKKSKYDVGWRHLVRNFTPSWFSVTMGTGIVAILLESLPFDNKGLHYTAIGFYIFNTILFFTALLVSLIRYLAFRGVWTVMIQDPVNSLFLGTIPMGFATLINCWCLICVPILGSAAKTVAFALWIVDAVIAVAGTLFLPFQLMSRSDISSLDRITAAQLLPIAATVVASGIGAKVATVQDDPQRTINIAIASTILFGMSIPFSFMILVLYYHRLAVHKLPAREVIVSAFLPLGPCGYGGTILLLLGSVSLKHLPDSITRDNPQAGHILHAISVPAALMFWGFGLIWFFFALAAIIRSWPLPFNMGWWGFTFPLGVYSACTLQLGQELESHFFQYLGTVFSCFVFLLWLVVATNTVKGALSKQLFYAPCLQNLKTDDAVPEADSVVASRRV